MLLYWNEKMSRNRGLDSVVMYSWELLEHIACLVYIAHFPDLRVRMPIVPMIGICTYIYGYYASPGKHVDGILVVDSFSLVVSIKTTVSKRVNHCISVSFHGLDSTGIPRHSVWIDACSSSPHTHTRQNQCRSMPCLVVVDGGFPLPTPCFNPYTRIKRGVF